MFEGFPGKSKEGLKYNESPMVQKTLEIFRQAKEYIKGVKTGAKITATLLFSLGAFEMAQAQTDASTLENTITKIEAGETTVGVAVNQMYADLKNSNDPSGSAVIEVDHSFEKGNYTGGVKVGGEKLALAGVGDTAKLGDVYAKNFSVLGTQNNEGTNLLGKQVVSTNERGKFFTMIKTQPTASETDSTEKKNTIFSTGKTPQEAALSALSLASGLKSSKIESVSSLKTENTATSKSAHSNSKFTNISMSQSDNVLQNAWVVISEVPQKDGGGFSAEVIYQ